MGYTIDFTGQFNLDKPLTVDQKKYLETFNNTRRMKRDSKIADTFSDPVRKSVDLPIGIDGEFFVGNMDDMGQTRDESIVEYNEPPSTQPSLWCQWIPNDEGTAIEWDGNEKFYEYIEWIDYLIKNFLNPWGYKVSGDITWEGEDSSDFGKIVIINNIITIKKGTKHYN